MESCCGMGRALCCLGDWGSAPEEPAAVVGLALLPLPRAIVKHGQTGRVAP